MTTLGDLTTRIQMFLQDEGAQAWEPAHIRRMLDHVLLGYARQHVAQDLLWCQAVQGKAHYPLHELGLRLTAGLDTSGTTGNLTTLTDAVAELTFLALPDPVAIGDRVRNLTDGSTGIVTTVNATTLVCAAGFTGGMENAIDTGDAYVVERPFLGQRVVTIHAVLYDGLELWRMTPEAMDRLNPQWERHSARPKYWSADRTVTPSVVRIHPAPLHSGSTLPNFPMNPLAQRWEENLVFLVSQHPQQTQDAAEVLHCLAVHEDALVFETAGRLAGQQGQWQNVSVSAGAQALAAVYRKLGGW